MHVMKNIVPQALAGTGFLILSFPVSTASNINGAGQRFVRCYINKTVLLGERPALMCGFWWESSRDYRKVGETDQAGDGRPKWHMVTCEDHHIVPRNDDLFVL